jgi:diketogulonate reductase-like aldo/keto reductase
MMDGSNEHAGRVIRGVRVPGLLYGTAWKEEATESLVFGALTAGFRGLDTANQRKHYDEAGVGRAIARALAAGLRRDELFVQTKFTHLGGQDHRLPYDPAAPIAEQVAQSFDSSLAHLGVERIDSLVLHGPSQQGGLAPADREAWRAIEGLAEAGRVALIGVSNVTAGQIRAIVELARVPPAFVQNRCYAARGWDRAIRALCAEHGIVYQAFSLLTANRDVVAHRGVRAIAARHGKKIKTEDVPFDDPKAYVALARGWERQLDYAYNGQFLAGTLDSNRYRTWLYENSVEYVALPDAQLDSSSTIEAKLLERGQPYLQPIWHDAHWRVWRFLGYRGLVDGPARLVSMAADSFTLQVLRDGTVTVHIHASPHWRVRGRGCATAGPDDWIQLRALEVGEVRVSQGLRGTPCTTPDADDTGGSGSRPRHRTPH